MPELMTDNAIGVLWCLVYPYKDDTAIWDSRSGLTYGDIKGLIRKLVDKAFKLRKATCPHVDSVCPYNHLAEILREFGIPYDEFNNK